MKLELTVKDARVLLRALYHDLNGPERERLYSAVREAAEWPPDLKADKLWGGLTTGIIKRGPMHSNQRRTVVRARSKAEAVRMLAACGETMGASHFTNYWSITGNMEELMLAEEAGGPAVMVNDGDKWVRVMDGGKWLRVISAT